MARPIAYLHSGRELLFDVSRRHGVIKVNGEGRRQDRIAATRERLQHVAVSHGGLRRHEGSAQKVDERFRGLPVPRRAQKFATARLECLPIADDGGRGSGGSGGSGGVGGRRRRSDGRTPVAACASTKRRSAASPKGCGRVSGRQ